MDTTVGFYTTCSLGIPGVNFLALENFSNGGLTPCRCSNFRHLAPGTPLAIYRGMTKANTPVITLPGTTPSKKTPTRKTTRRKTTTTKKTRSKKTTSRKTLPVEAPTEEPLTEITRKRLTLVTAIITPTMGATFAHYAAELGTQGNYLGVIPLVIALAVLRVSLPHVAHGLQVVTRQPHKNCMSLAVGIDLGLLTCKGGLVLGGLSAPWLLWGLLTLLLTVSAVFNTVAYMSGDVDTSR